MNEAAVKALCVEFEFNAIGRRLFGDDFKAGRGFDAARRHPKPAERNRVKTMLARRVRARRLKPRKSRPSKPRPPVASNLKTIADVPHEYHLVTEAADREKTHSRLSAA